MRKSLIISRFNENISWLEEIKEFKIIIYNKGKQLSNKKFRKIIDLNNVGRESHTWLYHIVENYRDLDDINIFLQGRIDDLGCMAHQDPHDYLKGIDKTGFSASRYGLLGPLHWGWNVGIEKNKKYKQQWDSKMISRSKIGFKKFAKELFPEIPIIVPTSYGGCFAVKREIILQHNISFYRKLLDILSENKNPIEGHYMERLWCYLFTQNKLRNKAIIDVLRTKIERLKLRKMYT